MDREFRHSVIQPLKKSQPQLANFLAEACWTWQPETKSLSITLSDTQVQERMKLSNSLLLRFFQKALEPTPISPISKLSFLNRRDNPPQQWQEQTYPPSETASEIAATQEIPKTPESLKSPEQKRPLRSPVSGPTTTEGTSPDKLTAKQEPEEYSNKPDSNPPNKETTEETDRQKTNEQKTNTAPANPPQAPPSQASPSAGQTEQAEQTEQTEQAEPGDSREQLQVLSEQLIDDYSQLPPDLQILQKVLLAKVTEVRLGKTTDRKDQTEL
ncbi:hypothetical protein P0082_01650 [Candidatus Haliotispira prima]|uniref:Uncharacterized protein n=1 Tax=Candidatus Haliotispira prima TaxID=3034016 RepID=A0ABY8MHW0_9SPIO|nr:hypothetical protein P0082_01650 [Candidatus Haliotispira prima]